MVLTSLTLSRIELSTDGMKFSPCDVTADSILQRKGCMGERDMGGFILEWKKTVVVSGLGCSNTLVGIRWANFACTWNSPFTL